MSDKSINDWREILTSLEYNGDYKFHFRSGIHTVVSCCIFFLDMVAWHVLRHHLLNSSVEVRKLIGI